MTIKDIKTRIQVAPAYNYLASTCLPIANGENTEESDVDLLVYFDEKVGSLFDMSRLSLIFRKN